MDATSVRKEKTKTLKDLINLTSRLRDATARQAILSHRERRPLLPLGEGWDEGIDLEKIANIVRKSFGVLLIELKVIRKDLR
jgi:hypothetical protein